MHLNGSSQSFIQSRRCAIIYVFLVFVTAKKKRLNGKFRQIWVIFNLGKCPDLKTTKKSAACNLHTTTNYIETITEIFFNMDDNKIFYTLISSTID